MSTAVALPAPRGGSSPLLLAAILVALACIAAASVLASPLLCAAVVVAAGCIVLTAVKIEAVLLCWIAVGVVLPNIRLLEYQERAGYGLTLAGEFLALFVPAALYQLVIARRYGEGAVRTFLPVLLFGLASLAWLPLSVDILWAIRRSLDWVSFYLFASLAYQQARRSGGVWPLVSALVIASLTVCAVSAVQLFFGVGIDHPGRGLVRGLFDHKNILGYFLVTVLPLCVALGFAATRARRLPWFALNALLLVTLFFSLSRAAWLACLAALLVVVWLFNRGKRWVLSAGLGALLLLTAIGVWFVLEEDLHGSSLSFRSLVFARAVDMGSYSTRAQVWNGLLYFLSRHPEQWLLGHGDGAAVEIINSSSYMPHVNSTHNLYLRLFVERGIVGLGLFLLLVGWLARRLMACRRACEDPVDRALCTGAIGALVAHLVFNVGGDEFIGVAVTPYLWVLAGLAFAAQERARASVKLSTTAQTDRLAGGAWPALAAAPANGGQAGRSGSRVSSRDGWLDERT